MGKIRVKTLGDESAETEAKKEAKIKKEQKKAREEAVVSPEAAETEVKPTQAEKTAEEAPKAKKKVIKKKSSKAARSAKYAAAKLLTDSTKKYALSEALDLLPQLKISSFDETVELHINTTETGISGNITLPHGTGKKTRVVIATEEIIAQIMKGKIEFDILIATPSMMPKLAPTARVLGPKGLMPNPKTGTVTDKPEEIVKKFEAGQIRFKTEAKAPIIHLTVGKLSFGKEKLTQNIEMMLKAIPSIKVLSVTLKSTMSPALKLNVVAN